MSTSQKTNTESRVDSHSPDSTISATPVTQLISSTAVTLMEGRSGLTTLVTSDLASTNGVEDDETDRTRAIDDADEAILEAALDLNQMAPRSAQRKKPALEADPPEETAAADLVLPLV